ncbi:MAG: transglutaminase family protein [Rhodocyclaceae bacterium]|jgi:transglutaminase-like putative cysteine protease|nr:transglutaminase family protein [Rhodocyclaceae bacterium]MCA3073400.1 transglutaminase family protein [Rhodocyclaceae bacterium]MCA3088570.1 transglutaminase family protein [Rhodocyclaceae bacterium]MCA3092646.1 transglutaminase family protein [Rhodocyclaceae bacterium]MCA3098567.1 transglutaminase family protein [Rhodocyclaceae bacterium]
MNYRISHRTEYHYAEPVDSGYNEARLLPRVVPRQVATASALAIDPPPSDYRERLDYFGNRVASFSIDQPHRSLTVTATSEVAVEPRSGRLELFEGESWEKSRGILMQSIDAESLTARDFVLDSPLVAAQPGLADYATGSFTRGRSLLESVHDLMERIHRDFRYDPEFTTLSTPLTQVLEHRRGVCQDFAHLAIGCIRSQGLPARYVSGYIETLPPPGKPRLVGADASHAWFSVFVPDAGWVDFDPTNNQMPETQHITVAWGRDYSDVTPLKGIIFGGGRMTMKVAVDVLNLDTAGATSATESVGGTGSWQP